MKIRYRLFINATISIILVIILGIITFVTSNSIDEKREQHERAHYLQTSVVKLDSLTYSYLLEPTSATEALWNTTYHETAAIIGEDIALSVRADYAVYGDLFTELLLNGRKTDRLIEEDASIGEITINRAIGAAIVPRILAVSQQIVADTNEIAEEAFASMISTQETSRNLSLILVIAFTALITIISIAIARNISGILNRLNDFTQKISEGETLLQDEINGSHIPVKVSSDVKTVVDQLTRMQGELLRSERMATLGQFSGNISHELRNPLGVIDSSVYYLKMKLKDADEKTLEHLNRIKAAVDNSSAIIESLLNLTRMKNPDFADIDLKAIVNDAIATSKLPKTITVNKDFPEIEVMINGDHEQLRMALKNIVKNANEAMGGEGTLTVTIENDTNDGKVIVSIKDSGPGIAQEDLDKVFLPLFTKKVKGIGFGLSIAQMVIEKHNARIEARSAPNEGAEFIITLPGI